MKPFFEGSSLTAVFLQVKLIRHVVVTTKLKGRRGVFHYLYFHNEKKGRTEIPPKGERIKGKLLLDYN